MFQGFYTLTSGVLSQTRNLNVVSNNMANATTPGYKADNMTISDFQEQLLLRTGNTNKSGRTVIGTRSMIAAASEVVTNYTQGGISATGDSLDFSIYGNGFFCIQTNNGTVYTRNGDFSLDNEGYLTLPGYGRVLGDNGPIRLGTDRITADQSGNLYSEDGRNFLGRLRVVDFDNYEQQLTKTDGGVFIANGNATPIEATVQWKALESSNADPIDQMTRMMASQRALQSSAQIMKIYDQLTSKIVSELGSVS